MLSVERRPSERPLERPIIEQGSQVWVDLFANDAVHQNRRVPTSPGFKPHTLRANVQRGNAIDPVVLAVEAVGPC